MLHEVSSEFAIHLCDTSVLGHRVQGHVIRSLWTVINATLSSSCSALRRVLIFRSGVSLLLISNVDGLVYFIVGISCSAANMTGMSQISEAEALRGHFRYFF